MDVLLASTAFSRPIRARNMLAVTNSTANATAQRDLAATTVSSPFAALSLEEKTDPCALEDLANATKAGPESTATSVPTIRPVTH